MVMQTLSATPSGTLSTTQQPAAPFDKLDEELALEFWEESQGSDIDELLQDAAVRWRTDPVSAYMAWRSCQRVSGREFDEHSLEQYSSMWGRYCVWLQTSGIALDRISAADVDRFLLNLRGGRQGLRPAAPSTKRRYLFLLHRTYAHLELLGVVKRNPVAELPELARHQAHERPARTLLTPAQEQAYIDWCLSQPAQRWDQLRNRALRLLFLASGITVFEARMLQMDQVVIADLHPTKGLAGLLLPAHGNTPARQAPVAAFAVNPLYEWLRARNPAGATGTSLFPAGRRDTLQGLLDPDQGHLRPTQEPLSAEEIYGIVSTGLRACGFDGRRAGPATLRNAYMARQIRKGYPLDLIRDWTGLRTIEQLRALQRQVPIRGDGLKPV